MFILSYKTTVTWPKRMTKLEHTTAESARVMFYVCAFDNNITVEKQALLSSICAAQWSIGLSWPKARQSSIQSCGGARGWHKHNAMPQCTQLQTPREAWCHTGNVEKKRDSERESLVYILLWYKTLTSVCLWVLNYFVLSLSCLI